MAFSLLFLLRRLPAHNPNLKKCTRCLFLFHHSLTPKPFSSVSSLQTSTTSDSSDQPKPSSLSARMSFVFDQIDAIEKERSQKDETLQRIRAWRESKRSKTNEENTPATPALELASIESDSNESRLKDLNSAELEVKEREGLLNKAVELVHPWPEWIELMERLVQQNYFDHKRKDEDKMIEDLGFDMSDVAEEGFDFTRDWKTVQTACLNFGRDRFDILRSLSRQDIQVLVGYGCPSAEKKVVFSAKLLRKHVHLDEGDVCSSCSLRSSCERAYLLTNKEDEARTLDVMRVLLNYGFDPVKGSVDNKSLLKIKSLKIVVRKLLHEVVKLSAVPIDPNLPPPVIKKPPPKVKQPPPPPKKRVGRDDIEMKKGDWLCPKCDFMNFAKNTACLQCDAKRPKRQLLPGEWECPQCNFLNYRRNVVCFHCEHKRPPDAYTESQMQERQRGPGTRLEMVSRRPEVSKGWNFDFDDDESDGADVAAFEYADSHRLDKDFPLDHQEPEQNFRGPEDGFYKNSRPPRVHESKYSDPHSKKPGIGFDDFDDDEDDVDNYELDTQNNNQVQKAASVNFSELEISSESEDAEGSDDNWHARRQTKLPTRNKQPKPICQKEIFSGSEDDELDFESDEDLPVHPKWKSSHVADSKQRSRGRRAASLGSGEDLGLSSGSEDNVDEDFGSKQNRGKKWGSGRRDFGRRGRPNAGDGPFSSLESDDDDLHFRGNRLRGNKSGPDVGRRKNFGNDRGFRGDDHVHRQGFGRRGRPNAGDEPFSSLESDDDDLHFPRNRLRGNKSGPDVGRRKNFGNDRGFQGDDHVPRQGFGRRGKPNAGGEPFSSLESDDDDDDDLHFRRNGLRGNKSGPDVGRRRKNFGDDRGFQGDDHGPRQGFGKLQRGRSHSFKNRSDVGSFSDYERYRRPRINVR